MNIFDKYIFTSDGTWFVKDTRVFMDFFATSTVCPEGIRQAEGKEGDHVDGEYYLDGEACGIEEFYINGKSTEDMTDEELDAIEVEYQEEIKKYSKEELRMIYKDMMLEELRKLRIKELKNFRTLNALYYKELTKRNNKIY